jgi:hypothetical protein
MKILDAAAKLNDDFTPCLKVEIQGNVYYLIKNDKLELLGKNKLGTTYIFRDAAVLNDTVRLAAANLTLMKPDKKKGIHLQKGKILERYFRQGKKTFVRLGGLHPEYGWVEFSDKSEYVVIGVKDTHLDLPLNDEIQKRIRSKLGEANAALKELFAYFNSAMDTKKNAPQWRFIALDRQYTCMLEPAEYAEKYSESTLYLTGDIDNLLLGTNYGAVGSPGKIDICQK